VVVAKVTANGINQEAMDKRYAALSDPEKNRRWRRLRRFVAGAEGGLLRWRAWDVGLHWPC
jgi:hypothetical protein